MARGSGRPSVAIVTPVVPSRLSPNGFSSRILDVADALADVADLRLVHLCDGSDRHPDDERGFVSLRVPSNPLNAPGMSGWLRRVKHYAVAEHPYWAHLRRVPEPLHHLLVGVDVVVLHLPELSRLASELSREASVVYLVEEAWEQISLHHAAARGRVRRAVARAERRRASRLYRKAAEAADAVVAISPEEAARLRSSGVLDVEVLPLTMRPRPPRPEHDETIDVIIVGDFRQPRNLAPTLAFLRQWQATPATQPFAVRCVGPTEEIEDRRLAGCFVGEVDDVWDLYARARVAALPMAAVSGVKSTFVQAIAAGVPVAAVRAATNGIAENILVETTVVEGADELVHACLELLTDHRDAQESARRAQRMMDEMFTRSHRKFAELCVKLAVSRWA